jgi:hypothetical protein
MTGTWPDHGNVSARKRRALRKRFGVSPRAQAYLDKYALEPPVKDFRVKRDERPDGTRRASFGKPRKRVGGVWRA